jgi:DMSO/TMAO reductase YedYZ molybdopterin-dependent catalytic subunit
MSLGEEGMNKTSQDAPQRRGFLKALGLGGAAAAAAGVAQAAGPLRADAAPAGTARKENEADRLKARYQPDSAGVQAFYRTNRYDG